MVSLPVVNTKQNKLGEERIYLTLPHCSPSLKESRTGAPVRNLEVGTGTETLGEHCFLGLAPFVRIQPEPPAVGGGGTAAQCAGPSNIIVNQENAPQASDGCVALVGLSS